MDEAFFAARVGDTAELCRRTETPRFLGFLSPSEAASAERLLKNQGVLFEFFGGYSGAERTYLCCKPEWVQSPDYPLCAVTASFRKCDSLSHRDILGALMALGITRESVGDILIEAGRAVFFVSRDTAPFVLAGLEKAGRVGIKLSEGFSLPLPQMSCGVQDSTTVASLRLDCVTAALCGLSRANAVQAIADGRVTVNSLAAGKPTQSVRAEDILAVRGKGRFKIDSVDEYSKKGRIILRYKKFV